MESKIISRDFFRKDIEYYQDNRIYYYQDFIDSINKWKNILYFKYNMRPGMSIALLDKNAYFEYCTLFFAVAELGLKSICMPERPKEDGKVKLLDLMLKDTNKVDLMFYISDDNLIAQTVTMALPKTAIISMANNYAKQIMNFDAYENYDASLYDNSIAEQIFATEDSVLSWTATSGTTGTPKLLEYTQRQLYNIALRNSRIFGFDELDVTVCHTRNMHHAAILMANFLPAFSAVRYHCVPKVIIDETDLEFVERFTAFVKEKQIHKVFLPFSLMLESMFKYINDNNIKFDHNLDIICGGFNIPKPYIDFFAKTNVNRIISMFGSNETLGPILVKIIDHNINVDNYNPQYIGIPLDDMYTITLLENNRISVRCSQLYDGEIIMHDTMSGNSTDGFVHLGRFLDTPDGNVRINEVLIQPVAVKHLVGHLFPACQFEVVLDPQEERLYLAIWEGSVDFDLLNHRMLERYERVQFNNYDYLKRSDFDNFKLDMTGLREYFKNKKTIGPDVK
jgi:acyl-coenzyme A synthetase/AMP-(fatty) acid ligase